MNELTEFFRGDENRDWLRTIGGILIAVGLLLVWIRRGAGSFEGGWGQGALFLVLLITFAFTYGTGMVLRTQVGEPRGWQTASLVFGVIVLVLMLSQFVDWIGGSSSSNLNQAWIYLVAAAAGAAAAVVARVRYGLLLAGLALILSWTNLWDEILSGGLGSHLGVTRGLFMIIAIILLVAAAGVRFGPTAIDRIRASELVTAAGLAVLIGAGLLSLTSFISIAGAASSTSSLFGNIVQGANLPVANPTWFWNLVLLSSSVLLIAFAARFAVRGPGYIGAIGIVVFVFLEGFDVDALLKAIREGATSPPGGELIWWPLLLILVGLAAFIASFGGAGAMAERLRGGAAPAPPPPSAPQPPPSASETAVSPQPPPAPPPTEESPGPG